MTTRWLILYPSGSWSVATSAHQLAGLVRGEENDVVVVEVDKRATVPAKMLKSLVDEADTLSDRAKARLEIFMGRAE
jgi:hypothetical protein